jgi:two-component system CheB/CheR fusion protein
VATNEELMEVERDGEVTPASPPMAVVGVGVCGASLASLEALFAGLGPRIGAAYLIAARQEEGLNVERVVDALKRQSALPVEVARDGTAIKPNHIYVGAPDDMITLEDGHVRTRPAAEPVGRRGTIDSMLISLAEHAQDRAIAVLLSGLGAEGTAGITATKNFGGLSIAELLEGEEAEGQEGEGPFGVVDLRLPIEEIATQIARYAQSVATVAESGTAEEVPDEIEEQVSQIATILRNVTTNDFHGYKRGTFVRRVQRRMQVTQTETVPAYVARLREDRGEV